MKKITTLLFLAIFSIQSFAGGQLKTQVEPVTEDVDQDIEDILDDELGDDAADSVDEATAVPEGWAQMGLTVLKSLTGKVWDNKGVTSIVTVTGGAVFKVVMIMKQNGLLCFKKKQS